MAHFSNTSGDDSESRNNIRAMFGPGQADQSARQGGRTTDALETQFRRLVDRAFKDFREDAKAFGLDP